MTDALTARQLLTAVADIARQAEADTKHGPGTFGEYFAYLCAAAAERPRLEATDLSSVTAKTGEYIETDFQTLALIWAIDIFGDVAADKSERAMRFIEEAVELIHAAQLDRRTLSKIIERVYSRPPGAIDREFGQAAFCLATLGKAWGVHVETEMRAEFARVQSIPKEEWERRHAAKTKIGITADAPIRAPEKQGSPFDHPIELIEYLVDVPPHKRDDAEFLRGTIANIANCVPHLRAARGAKA